MTVKDLGWADQTRIRCLYDLTPRLPSRPTRALVDAFDFGRFRLHVDASAQLLPTIADTVTLPAARLGATLGGRQLEFSCDLTVLVLVTPRRDPVLLLDVTMPDRTGVDDVVQLLAATCFERASITINDQPLLRWVADRLGLAEPPRFGRNVHHCVFPGEPLRGQILPTSIGELTPAVTDIIYRGTVAAGAADGGGRLGVWVPKALVNPGETLVAHGRGVSLIAGWGPAVQNILTITAAMLVSALSVLQRVRELAYAALAINQNEVPHSTAAARALVARLSTSMNELQLDLSFGVEACMDSVLVPELVVDSYQQSLRQINDVGEALANTSRMVERLAAVIGARAAVLETAMQDEQERKSRVFNAILAIGSLIALPPSLLLAFFGVASPDVDPTRSITDLGRYWLAYALAWLPFAALLLVGFILRRRIRERSPLFDDPEAAVRGSAPTARPPRQPAPPGESDPATPVPAAVEASNP
ncbi:MAG TPA: hypothetical protein VIL37_03045 [Natronosporangium sp.]